ncbi:hypothetical protein O9K51_08407 [Purpureocillium lavendulum]|uniref:Uncharacterized protein n=1 Tax=Purpureocillium lavendulum TaxID=1247861 RepID=A0AB34FIW6_9HYPO|nr:hypothetical protein O9K51_08407 [Purpureocillium lavendulum]
MGARPNLRAFTAGSTPLAAILRLCRANDTTLTGLVHGIALLSFAAPLNPTTAPGFVAGTANAQPPKGIRGTTQTTTSSTSPWSATCAASSPQHRHAPAPWRATARLVLPFHHIFQQALLLPSDATEPD